MTLQELRERQSWTLEQKISQDGNIDIISPESLCISEKISNFALANKMIVNYPDGRRLSLKSAWTFFMSILYPHTAVSLRKIKPFGVYHLVSSASDTAFCVYNPKNLNSMEQEIWKDIEGYEGLYQVSNMGRVRSLERKVVRSNGTLFSATSKLLSIKKTNGYVYVNLYSNGKGKTYSVHRLVALAFVDNPNNLPEIDHINTIRDDNRHANLRWTDRKGNMENGITKITHKEACRHRVYAQSTLDALDKYRNKRKVAKCDIHNGEVLEIYDTIRDAAVRNNVNEHSICNVCGGRRKSCGGYKWKYC